MKTCKQCGAQQVLSNFRPCYNREGTYSICLGCERINSRHKYLRGKLQKTDADKEELSKINELYALQQEVGLRPPKKQKINYDELIVTCRDKPHALDYWLTAELTKKPEYYNNIYEQLRETYRPRTGTDPATYLPVYDDTYKDVLEKILQRFVDYEEK